MTNCHNPIAITACLLLITLITASCRPASVSKPTETTKQLWQQCAICHGTIEMQRGPIIDGMDAWVVELQLQKFAAGIRGKNLKNRSEHLMGGAIDKVPDRTEMKRLANYVASLPPRPHLTVVKGDVAAGGKLYQARCRSCHGDKAQGSRLLKAPPLSELEDWFVADQMRKFAGGRRGTHPDDIGGQLMAAAAKDLTQKQIRDLAVWIAKQSKVPAERHENRTR